MRSAPSRLSCASARGRGSTWSRRVPNRETARWCRSPRPCSSRPTTTAATRGCPGRFSSRSSRPPRPSRGSRKPCSPKSTTNINPATTGETEKGKSISVTKRLLPGKENFAIDQAAARPKTRLAGTAMAATIKVSFTAAMASGSRLSGSHRMAARRLSSPRRAEPSGTRAAA